MPCKFGNSKKLLGCIGNFMLVIKPNFRPAEVAYVFIALEAFKIVDFWSDFLIYWVKSYDRDLDLVKSYYGYLAGCV